ncbi:MAG: cell envelope integrity protein TolA [Candidatus Sedimenticola sp. (ex Thyasira tokunagai)]
MLARLILILILLSVSLNAAALNIEITRGAEGALPVAVVPFGWAGPGVPPAEDVADIVRNDLARSGRFSTMPVKEREAELQAKMRQEQFAREGMSVRAAIFNKVADNWIYMPGAVEKGLKCTVRVRLGANGTVLLAQVAKSSGDTAFDHSVETAVRKSEPLPMPSTPELRNHPDFREHIFVFEPSQSR